MLLRRGQRYISSTSFRYLFTCIHTDDGWIQPTLLLQRCTSRRTTVHAQKQIPVDTRRKYPVRIAPVSNFPPERFALGQKANLQVGNYIHSLSLKNKSIRSESTLIRQEIRRRQKSKKKSHIFVLESLLISPGIIAVKKKESQKLQLPPPRVVFVIDCANSSRPFSFEHKKKRESALCFP